MQLLILIMRDAKKLEELLLAFSAKGIGGATVLDCQGMGEILVRSQRKEDIPFYDLISELLDANAPSGKLVLMAATDECIIKIKETVYEVIGSLDMPNTGVMFGVPISFAEGFR